MHVSVMMLSYAGLLIGSILAITYIVISFFIEQENRVPENFSFEDSLQNSLEGSPSLPNTSTAVKFQNPEIFPNLLILFDNLSYRIIGIGFCFFNFGILSGAVWANEAWGSYWSWDPKETWAFITWLVFAAYLHTRLIYGWQGRKPAIIACVGFLLVWICYLGVNLLGKGLHSYGFFN